MYYNGEFYLAKFKERPTRFLAIVELNPPGTSEYCLVKAHVPDPGRLRELLIPNAEVILQKSSRPSRKTQFSLIGIKTLKGIWVNIDSHLTNRLFQEDFQKISSLQHYKIIRSEISFSNSRFDFSMINDDTHQKVLVEVKSVTLVKNGVALFPDAPTARGVKHVKDLIRAFETNEYLSFIIFIIKRNDIFSFKPNKAIDPLFSQVLYSAIQKGVQVRAVKCLYDPISAQELKILGEVPLTLD